jgi:signal transduction histidine kinase
MKHFSHPGVEEKQAVNLNTAIENTLTVSRSEWKYTAEVVTDLDPELPLVPCYPDELNQVFLNMIVDAAHAIADTLEPGARDCGRITIRTRCAGEFVDITIADDGAGIPPEVQPRIFEPFCTTKGVGKGTGQGLAIAHAVIVQKHAGSIHLESEVGKGTTFVIRLPRGEANVSELRA